MKDIAEYRNYKVITLPQEFSSNCLYLNGTLLHCSQTDYPKSFEVSRRFKFFKLFIYNPISYLGFCTKNRSTAY